jgi:hypothetical protein
MTRKEAVVAECMVCTGTFADGHEYRQSISRLRFQSDISRMRYRLRDLIKKLNVPNQRDNGVPSWWVGGGGASQASGPTSPGFCPPPKNINSKAEGKTPNINAKEWAQFVLPSVFQYKNPQLYGDLQKFISDWVPHPTKIKILVTSMLREGQEFDSSTAGHRCSQRKINL